MVNWDGARIKGPHQSLRDSFYMGEATKLGIASNFKGRKKVRSINNLSLLLWRSWPKA
jgi:hypothetical protein